MLRPGGPEIGSISNPPSVWVPRLTKEGLHAGGSPGGTVMLLFLVGADMPEPCRVVVGPCSRSRRRASAKAAFTSSISSSCSRSRWLRVCRVSCAGPSPGKGERSTQKSAATWRVVLSSHLTSQPDHSIELTLLSSLKLESSSRGEEMDRDGRGSRASS